MPPYRTTEDGTLKEWGWPGLDENYDQRHVSHLYGDWPSDEIQPTPSPDLARAALLADRKPSPAHRSAPVDRKSVGSAKSVSVRVETGGLRSITKKKHNNKREHKQNKTKN